MNRLLRSQNGLYISGRNNRRLVQVYISGNIESDRTLGIRNWK